MKSTFLWEDMSYDFIAGAVVVVAWKEIESKTLTVGCLFDVVGVSSASKSTCDDWIGWTGCCCFAGCVVCAGCENKDCDDDVFVFVCSFWSRRSKRLVDVFAVGC